VKKGLLPTLSSEGGFLTGISVPFWSVFWASGSVAAPVFPQEFQAGILAPPGWRAPARF